jgi:diguanylate cyclase (GGDEF)-like protein
MSSPLVSVALVMAWAAVMVAQQAGVPPAIAPEPRPVNPRVLAGVGALLVTALLLVLYFYRRRRYILYWIVGWLLTAVAMLLAGRRYAAPQLGWFAYGLSQFLAIIASLVFVVSADAYTMNPRLRRGYAVVLLPVAIWFTLAPLALGPAAVFAPGHLLTAGGLTAAAAAYLVLLRDVRLMGAAVVGASLLLIAATNVWIALRVPQPDAVAADRALFVSLALYLVAALGMQLMTFEDMTYELRRTNRRLETAQAGMRQMVITDPLTGCHNRRFFDEVIRRELQRHLRYRIPLSLLFIDVNRFKAINDTLGHEAGDRVLRQVATFLKRSVREADYVFRWGGDEFLILISCREEEARRRGIALQNAFASSPDAAFLPAGVGLSIGSAEVPADTDDVMAHVKLADERMYENKREMK